MKPKKYTQTGTICIILFLPLLLIFVIRLFRIGISLDTESVVFQFLALVSLLCLLTFYKLSIFIDEKKLSFKFGIGWFGKSYPLSEIETCKSMKIQWLYGVGVRWLFDGWLYNVSGLKAIELRFKNKKTIVRIGTDRPGEICEAVKKFMC